MQRWISTCYSCIANNIPLNKLQAGASVGVEKEICENGARWTRKQSLACYAGGWEIKPNGTLKYLLNSFVIPGHIWEYFSFEGQFFFLFSTFYLIWVQEMEQKDH